MERQRDRFLRITCAQAVCVLGVAAWWSGAGCAADPMAPVVQVRVLTEVENTVSEGLFGQFLERASFGEPGPEAALIPGTHRLRPDAVSAMEAMRIPVIRFPGGSDVDYLDWRDMIDNVPGRSGGRPISYGLRGDPITNRFGYDEYFELRDRLGNETILVVNLLDAVSRRLPLDEAAIRAAGLVAYANAPVGAALPPEMPDWPAVRARNGSPTPFGADYVQLGNESHLWPHKRLVDEDGRPMDAAGMAAWMRDCFATYVARIRAVDPEIRIIVDGTMPLGVEREVLADGFLRQSVDFVAFHSYAPGPMARLKRDGAPIPQSAMDADDWWRAWTAMPGGFGPSGQNLGLGTRADVARDLGYEIAVTEWNWNGWETGDTRLPAPLGWQDWRIASGLGAAGFLHGLMRGEASIATQSMLLGANWSIAAVHVDPDGTAAPFVSPQAQVATLYRHHHGHQRLRIETSPLETYEQPVHMGWMAAAPGTVASLDLLATRTPDRLYLHAVNRDANRDFSLEIDLGLFALAGDTTRLTWTAASGFSVAAEGALAQVTETAQPVEGARLGTVLPARSVTILSIGLAGH